MNTGNTLTDERLTCRPPSDKRYNLPNLSVEGGEAEDLMNDQRSRLPSAPDTCRHHWVIQLADGPISLDICKFCHEAREFENSLYAWDPEPSPNLGIEPGTPPPSR